MFYASQAPDFEGAPQNVSQLGANVITSFVVRNSGPSTIPEVQLTVWWPLNSTESAQEERMGTFLFYPAQITVSFNLLALKWIVSHMKRLGFIGIHTKCVLLAISLFRY